MPTFRIIIDIDADDRHEADLLRDEVVGAIEDNVESGEIGAEGYVGPLEEVK